ncbi:hypothetical protein PR048_014584 [Dryococelus australis]|uniref:Uncharacterized protein n=1 Tax=Dryococelus australis TaxID=614101 RepID=A0ABQ9HF20_9NEOP|nr:hypothetical protein PR048_014584 [Dryococelus australis]
MSQQSSACTSVSQIPAMTPGMSDWQSNMVLHAVWEKRLLSTVGGVPASGRPVYCGQCRLLSAADSRDAVGARETWRVNGCQFQLGYGGRGGGRRLRRRPHVHPVKLARAELNTVQLQRASELWTGRKTLRPDAFKSTQWIADCTGNRDALSEPSRYDVNTARLAHTSDEALGVRVSVTRIAPSLLDLGRRIPTGVHPTLKVSRYTSHLTVIFKGKIIYKVSFTVRNMLHSGHTRVEGDASCAEIKGLRKCEIPEKKTRRPTASSGTIPTRGNAGATPTPAGSATFTLIGFWGRTHKVQARCRENNYKQLRLTGTALCVNLRHALVDMPQSIVNLKQTYYHLQHFNEKKQFPSMLWDIGLILQNVRMSRKCTVEIPFTSAIARAFRMAYPSCGRNTDSLPPPPPSLTEWQTHSTLFLDRAAHDANAPMKKKLLPSPPTRGIPGTTAIRIPRANVEHTRPLTAPIASPSYRGATVAEWSDCSPAFHQGEQGHSWFSQVGIVQDDAAVLRVFLGKLLPPPPALFAFQRCSVFASSHPHQL